MLRRNRAAMTRERNEKATWPTIRAFEKVSRRRLLPVERVSSLRVPATPAREARRAGMAPKRKPVTKETASANKKTVELSFGAIRLEATSGGRNDHKRIEPK